MDSRTQPVLTSVNDFWRSLCTNEFYDCGYSDVVLASAADCAVTFNGAILAISFIRGSAYTARTASPHGGRHWRIADILEKFCANLIRLMCAPTANAFEINWLISEVKIELNAELHGESGIAL